MLDPQQSIVSKTCSKTGFGKVPFKGKFLLAKGTYEGEEIVFKLAKNKKSIDSVQVLKPHLKRNTTECPHFAECGGCALLGLNIDAQLEWKEKMIQELFLADQEKIQTIISNPAPHYYRNKVEFTFSQNLKMEKKLGFNQFGSRGFAFSTQSCLLIPKWMIQAKLFVEKLFIDHPIDAFYLPKMTGILKNLVLRSNQDLSEGIVALVVQDTKALSDAFLKEFVEGLETLFQGNIQLSYFLIENKVQKGVPTKIDVTHLYGKTKIKEVMEFNIDGLNFNLEFMINSTSFFQPNPSTAKLIYQKSIQLLDICDEDVVLDLYCGSGTFGMVASKFAKKVIGIELNESAIIDAKKLAEINQIKNIEFFAGDAKIQIKNVVDYKINKMIIDPPRAGLDPSVIETILQIDPVKMVYVSCNPMTQKNDVEILKQNGFEVETIVAVDQFTHTPHIENIVVLKNSKSRYNQLSNHE